MCVCVGGVTLPLLWGLRWQSEAAQAEVSPADIASSSRCHSNGDN